MRNVCGYAQANSTEFEPECSEPAIAIMEHQKAVYNK
jgi:CTP synthase (UTP-ammonia lyase)